ncbi:MAG: DNA polymerase III subunit gamma/tau [Chloroflexota bacterium]|nr:DNA polymerase III subunit gamma/tau [Chloroflexota bacterium]MDE2894531.1 DNA polymerase III subunit gamma/tau [Chloroflexota bacterium]
MSGAVLYRKWRPADFDEVVGQETVVRTLRNAVAQDKISHAYLFCGPRGTGKTTTARILARAINGRTASTGATALGEMDDLGFDLVEIDAASNRGIDDIRELRERANYQPGSARFKVYLIDEVHQLTGAAADALLKTLEEPPPHVVFILATTDPEALKPTILSRCQRFDFRRVSVDDMVLRLNAIAEAEGIDIPDEALRLISREATGSLRDGVNLLDQVWVMCGATISLEAAQEALGLSPDARAAELASAALRGELAEGLAVLSAVQEDAIDFGRFKRQVVIHLRHALLKLTGATGTLSLSAPELERLDEICQGVDAQAAVTALRAFSEADVRRDPYQPLPLELALASIVYDPPPAPAPSNPAPQQRTQQRTQSSTQQRPQRQQRPDAQRRPPRQSSAREQQATRNLPDRTTEPQQPARTAEPVAEAAAGQGLLDQIVGTLMRRDKVLAAAVRDGCQSARPVDNGLVLEFPAHREGYMKRCQDALPLLSEVAEHVLKRPVQVECILLSQSNGPAAGASGGSQAKPPAQSSRSRLAEEAKSRFGARPFHAN